MNINLRKAKRLKNDEFYTRMEDIENELSHYKECFKGEVVYCNCDNPTWSNFAKYFVDNFQDMGLKKVILTHYDESGSSKTIYDGESLVTTPLKSNGDFRSEECIELLKEADIVVTNPPFSLFREYISQLIDYDKKFIILGNNNAITYKEVFCQIKSNNIWLGVQTNKTMDFQIPEHYETWSHIDENGNKIAKVPAISWFTNLPNKKRNEKITLFNKYYGNEDNYPKYDNYDAIEVSKTKDIPNDYDGYMAVPITFMCKYNPNQFIILGIMDRSNSSGLKTKVYNKDDVPKI
jgi:hypothetical protein